MVFYGLFLNGNVSMAESENIVLVYLKIAVSNNITPNIFFTVQAEKVTILIRFHPNVKYNSVFTNLSAFVQFQRVIYWFDSFIFSSKLHL